MIVAVVKRIQHAWGKVKDVKIKMATESSKLTKRGVKLKYEKGSTI